MHNPNIVHGSDENRSNTWRRGLVIKYISGDVDVNEKRPWPWAYLVRGGCSSSITKSQLKIWKDGI